METCTTKGVAPRGRGSSHGVSVLQAGISRLPLLVVDWPPQDLDGTVPANALDVKSKAKGKDWQQTWHSSWLLGGVCVRLQPIQASMMSTLHNLVQPGPQQTHPAGQLSPTSEAG